MSEHLPLDVSDWQRVSDSVARHMGLHFPPERLFQLQRGVRAALQPLDPVEAARLTGQLLGKPLARPQVQQLARHLTVGETYFFRDGGLMDALKHQVLPPLIHARRHDRRLRLWSAGCASGEEAYTLAILLHQLVPDIAEWDACILATDLNPAALEKAAEGVYDEWSFRKVPPAVKRAWFDPRPDGGHVIAQRARRLVRFAELNLVEDAWPRTRSGTDAMDLVLCRNVLMYFTPAQAAQVAARLHTSLAEGGWLAVSPCETGQGLFSHFATVNFPGAILYQKRSKARAASLPHDSRPAPAAAAARGRPADTAAPPTRDGAGASRRARALADGGNLEDALAVCVRWCEADKLDAGAHYLHAVVLAELGRFAPARASLQSVLFLDPEFVLAHVALLDLARREERAQEAARHLANARAILERLDPGQPLREGDGLLAGGLARMLASTGAGS